MICSVILLVFLRVGYLVLFHLCSHDDVIHQNLSRITVPLWWESNHQRCIPSLTGACSHEPWFCFKMIVTNSRAKLLSKQPSCQWFETPWLLLDDVMQWNRFPHYCPCQCVMGIHRSSVDSHTKGQSFDKNSDDYFVGLKQFFNKHSSCWWCETPWRHMLLLWWKLGSPHGNHGCRFSFRCSQWGSN